MYISRIEISSSLSELLNPTLRKINYEFDLYMVVFTDNRQGLDISLPTILK